MPRNRNGIAQTEVSRRPSDIWPLSLIIYYSFIHLIRNSLCHSIAIADTSKNAKSLERDEMNALLVLQID